MKQATGIKYIWVLVLILLQAGVKAQKISYSDTERDDYRQLNFDIIGKMGNNILIYKNYRTLNAITVYDNDMKIVDKFSLDFMPERVINADFVAYNDYAYMIYQFQRRNIVYCMGVRIGMDGKPQGDPVELDTTQIGTLGDSKIYSTIYSEDKQKIMVFKINKRDDRRYFVTTVLFDNQLKQLRKSRMILPIRDRDVLLSDFLLDNEGDFVFAREGRTSNRDFITKLDLVFKKADEDSFRLFDIGIQERYLDEVKLKADNLNRKYVINAFYYRQRRGNIEGMYSAIWDKATDRREHEKWLMFNDTLRAEVKSDNATLKMAFNDYYIRNIIPRRDGGYIVLAEVFYTNSRGQSWNRWDYLNRPFLSPLDYYYWSPYSYYWWNPWYRSNNFGSTRYYYEKIAVLSYDAQANLEWSNVINKEQYDDDTDNFLSYMLFNAGGKLHFLYNVQERRTMLLNSQSIAPDGQITRNPTLRNLDKGYEFMPKYGKQVGARTLVIPCLYRNYVSFAKIDF